MSETHEKCQIIVTQTIMYIVVKIFILHVRNLSGFQETQRFL